MLSLVRRFIILLCCITGTRKSRQSSGCHLTLMKHCFEKCRSHIINCLLIHTLGSWSQSSHLSLSLWGESEEILKLEADVSCCNPAAVAVASRDRTLTDWHSYYLDKSQMEARASSSVCVQSTPRPCRSVDTHGCKNIHIYKTARLGWKVLSIQMCSSNFPHPKDRSSVLVNGSRKHA